MVTVQIPVKANEQYDVAAFPSTRFMGSKRKLLDFISEVVSGVECQTVLDAFSGSGMVSYLFKSLGKTVTSNDYLAYSYNITNALVANSSERLSDADIDMLLAPNPRADSFIQDTFNGLYFTPEENAFLDNVSANVQRLASDKKRSLAVAALCRAAMKKQPRGVFTITGDRYNDGRRDLRLSMREQFLESIERFNLAVFDNGELGHNAHNVDIFTLPKRDFDLVYLDPPYYSTHSDNDYIRRYHFVEGLATYWRGVTIKPGSRTKRLEKRATPFSSRSEIYEAFERVFSMFPNSKFLVSYSSNSIPTRDEIVVIMKKYRRNVEVFTYEHRYSFGNHNHKVGKNNNLVNEYLFLGY